jgi:hypothetical protein
MGAFYDGRRVSEPGRGGRTDIARLHFTARLAFTLLATPHPAAVRAVLTRTRAAPREPSSAADADADIGTENRANGVRELADVRSTVLHVMLASARRLEMAQRWSLADSDRDDRMRCGVCELCRGALHARF